MRLLRCSYKKFWLLNRLDKILQHGVFLFFHGIIYDVKAFDTWGCLNVSKAYRYMSLCTSTRSSINFMAIHIAQDHMNKYSFTQVAVVILKITYNYSGQSFNCWSNISPGTQAVTQFCFFDVFTRQLC